jgi:hypothetical protein
MPRIHRKAQRDPHIPPDAKTQVRRNLSRCAFYGNRTSPTRARKKVFQRFTPVQRSGMHYVTCRSHRIQKHKFGVMCPGTHFVESIPVPPRARKILHRCFAPLTHRNALHVPQIPSNPEHEFRVMCPGALSVESVTVLHEHEK